MLVKESIQSPALLQAVQSVCYNNTLSWHRFFFYSLTVGKCYMEQSKCSGHPPPDQKSTWREVIQHANLLTHGGRAAALPHTYTEKSSKCHTSSTPPAAHTTPPATNFNSIATTGENKKKKCTPVLQAIVCLLQLSWPNWLKLLLSLPCWRTDKKKHEESLIHFREEKVIWMERWVWKGEIMKKNKTQKA